MAGRKPYPAELRERAVKMVFEVRAETENPRGSIARVAERLGINKETLRNWVAQAEIGEGQRPGTAHVLADYDNVPGSVRMAGLTALNLQAYGVDSSWLGKPMIAGTWYTARDQVDANTEFLTETGLHVGDRLTINVGRRRAVTKIVGRCMTRTGPPHGPAGRRSARSPARA